VQLQLSLTLADDLYDLLLMSGEPVDFLDAARRLLALKETPEALCRQVMDTLASDDRRFCWSSPTTLGLSDWKLADPDLADVAFVVVDLETTGTRAGLSKITEIGAVRIEGLREVATFETLVNPHRSIPPKVIEITGITPSMLVGAPRIEQVMPHFLDFLDGAVIVAHNAPFDLGFLNYELSRLRGRRLGEGAIDTVPLARCAAPGLPNYRLGTVADALGSRVAANHRALADALATAHVFLTCVGRLQERNITRLNELRSFVDPGHKRDKHKLALTRDIPRVPGAYVFRDGEGNVLYVGKADRLRDRVSSYFLSSANHSRKVRQAVRRMQRVDYEVTETPLRAVVREQELILEHRPPCNVLGRRPENYCYVKLGGRGNGLRLYASDRPGDLASGGVTCETMIGPFRGRSRVQGAIALLQKTYPIRQCRGVRRDGPCVYGQTESCLAPCNPDPALRGEHDELVRSLLAWLTGGSAPALGDPFERARAIRTKLAAGQRYEDAQEVHEALESLATLRRSYQALTEAVGLRTAVIWPLPGDDGARTAQLDLVWRGHLRASARLDAGTASLEIGRILRTLPASVEQAAGNGAGSSPSGNGRDRDGTSGGLAVRQEELDLLMAVRRWIREAPPASVVHFPEGDSHDESLEMWRQELVALARHLLHA
jgi:DNA polymerase-3 subunit epsilon